MKLKALLVGVVLASAFTSASALDVDIGNNPQIDSTHGAQPLRPGRLAPAGNPVFGCLNDDHAILAALSSDEDLDFSGGQATLEAADGAFPTLRISLMPLSTVILNINATEDGFVTFSDGVGLRRHFRDRRQRAELLHRHRYQPATS